ncbi:hypothetical protein LPJ61_004854, partial [Coemansia biformis]
MSGDDQEGLSQDDFRKLLQTPRTPGEGRRALTHSRGVLGKRRPPPPRTHTGAPTKQPKHTAHGLDDGKRYRDRAAERRREAVAGAAAATPASSEVLSGSIGMSEEHRAVYERSKYLGGSEERTHLVKGLDYLLLHKTRALPGAGGGGQDDLDLELEQLQTGEKETGSGVSVLEEPQTALGRCVADALSSIEAGTVLLGEAMGSPAARVEYKGDLFRPGRMYFELAPAALLSGAAPTVRIRGQDRLTEVPADSSQDGGGDALVIAKVVAAIGRRHAAGAEVEGATRADTCTSTLVPGGADSDTREAGDGAGAAAEAAAIAAVEPRAVTVEEADEDEDIFADAGVDYEVTMTERQE